MLDEAENLMTLKNQVESKQQILTDFNSHFLMSEDELVALTSSAEPVNDDFFQALVKAKQIHNDSEVLLGSENQRLGLEILEQCSKYLNAAFQKLFRWAQREFKALDLEDSHLSSTIRRALRVLAERPTLFQECLDTFAEVRERTLADAFYVALTGSTTDRESQRPIDFSAHEPLRYVGDMLAWAHSTAVSERESLEALFIAEGNEIAKSIEQGLESEPWSRPEGGETFDGRRALRQLVNRNLTGVAELLRQRVDTVVRTHSEPVLQYKIANLVKFYRNIFAKLLQGEDFMQKLDTIEDLAIAQFRTAMSIKITNIDEYEDTIPDTLEPPDFLDEALDELKELLQSYDTSLAMLDADGKALALLLEEALHPWMAACQNLATSLEVSKGHCFIVNCLSASKTILVLFPFTGDEVERVNQVIDDHKAALVESQHQKFLARSGISPLIDALHALSDAADHPEQVLTHKAFSSENLLVIRQQLDNFLPSAVMDSLSELKGLQNSTLSHEVSSQAVERFCEDFEKMEEAIISADALQSKEQAEDDETPTLRDVFPRTTEETRILLS